MANRKDLRPRLTVRGSGYSVPFKGPGKYLRPTNGIVFPFTPVITSTQSVDYAASGLLHSNHHQQSYSMTMNPEFIIQSTFASQTPDEARYLAGVIHFLRVVSKMHFGPDDPDSGTPPPVLEFSAYGITNFNRVPVLVSSYSTNFTSDTDMVEVDLTAFGDDVRTGFGDETRFVERSGVVHLPAEMEITITLAVHYSPRQQRRFTMRDFASGRLYEEGMI